MLWDALPLELLFFNFIHFLSAEFNLFDAPSHIPQTVHQGLESGWKVARTIKAQKEEQKIEILIMYINYVPTFLRVYGLRERKQE